jgi:phosphoglycolate phosphatase/putative hydrolase of the HAD superfamily
VQKIRQHLISLPKVVIFDVDGTLYDQTKLRKRIIWEILKFSVLHPNCLFDFKILWDFRKIREKNLSMRVSDIESQQYVCGAQVSRVPPEKVRQVVREWMFEKPLRYLPACRYQGVLEIFSYLRKKNIHTGIFSDYPVRDKLRVLGLSPDVLVCATDREVDRLKPDPKGLLVAAEKLRTPVERCLFVGDRDDRDGECARRAGMPYVIIDKNNKNCSNCFQNLKQFSVWFEKCTK